MRDQAPLIDAPPASGANGRSDRELIVVVASGSVAAANVGGLVWELCRRLPVAAAVVLTAGARRFTTPDAVEQLGGCDVVDDGSLGADRTPAHIWLTDRACCIVVYPASASFVGRMASGQGTDLASTTMLASTGIPTLVAPSMHPRMWANPLVQANLEQLRAAGMHVLAPRDGLAPGVSDICRHVVDLAHASTGGKEQR